MRGREKKGEGSESWESCEQKLNKDRLTVEEQMVSAFCSRHSILKEMTTRMERDGGDELKQYYTSALPFLQCFKG